MIIAAKSLTVKCDYENLISVLVLFALPRWRNRPCCMLTQDHLCCQLRQKMQVQMRKVAVNVKQLNGSGALTS